MFTKEESNAVLTFLGRCNLNGNEAEVLVHLKNKVRQMTEQAEVEAPKTEKKDK